ncbi:hypothetical protein [Mycetohabitans endofungorum]|nr:hypothetical protein [Mycetohabitans endofungorum]
MLHPLFCVLVVTSVPVKRLAKHSRIANVLLGALRAVSLAQS